MTTTADPLTRMLGEPLPVMPHYKAHPLADLYPSMSEEEFTALKTDIAQHGCRESITVWQEQILDGRHRYRAITELRADGQDIALGIRDFDGTEAEALAFVHSANFHRRHLTNEQRRQLIADHLQRTPQASDRKIATNLNVSPTTVGTVRKDLVAAGEVSKLDTRVGKNGVAQKASKPERVEETPLPETTPTPAPRPETAALLSKQEPVGAAAGAPTASITPTPEQAAKLTLPAAAAPSPFVTCLLPKDEYDWLTEQGIGLATALAELRALRDEVNVWKERALAAEDCVVTADAQRISAEAMRYLRLLTDHHNAKNPGHLIAAVDFLPVVLKIRCEQSGLLTEPEDNDHDA